MDIVDQYNLTLQIEVAKEQGAELLARIYHYLLPGKPSEYAYGELTQELTHIINTELYEVQTKEELKEKQDRISGLGHLLTIKEGTYDSKVIDDGPIESYSEYDFRMALRNNVEMLTYNKIQSVRPTAIILGGQSGAGKTTIHRVKMTESKGNYIVIDGDTYRAQHPHFRELQETYGADSVNYTKEFAGRMVESLIDILSKLHYNLIVEGTLRSAEVPMKTANLLRDKGYHVDFCLIATKPELSYLTTQIRYLEMMAADPLQARATPKKHHDGIVNSLLTNIALLEESQLFDTIQVYTRDLKQVYNSATDAPPVETVVEHILFGPWTYDEEKMLNYNKEREVQLRGQL